VGGEGQGGDEAEGDEVEAIQEEEDIQEEDEVEGIVEAPGSLPRTSLPAAAMARALAATDIPMTGAKACACLRLGSPTMHSG
jgi:hypothetical protein